MVRRPQLFIILKEQRRIGLLDLSWFLFLLFFGNLLGLALFQILSHASILVRNHLFHDGELSRLLGFAHGR